MIDTPTRLAPFASLTAALLERGSIGTAAAVERVYAAALTDGTPRPAGTMRAWMQAHDGQTVDTVQVRHDGAQGWAPTGRTIDAHSTAGAVHFGYPDEDEPNWSARYYAGCVVVAASPDGLIIDDGYLVVAYALADGPRP